MVLQIRKFQVKQGNPIDICRQAAKDLPPIIEKLPGFVHYAIVEGKGNFVFSVTVFEDENTLNQAFEKVRQWTREKVQDKLGEPEIIQGEVIYNTSPGKAQAA